MPHRDKGDFAAGLFAGQAIHVAMAQNWATPGSG